MGVSCLWSADARCAHDQPTKKRVEDCTILEQHPLVEKVLYPGLDSFPQHDLAVRQMSDYRGKFAPGSMLYFTLRDQGSDNKVAGRSSITLRSCRIRSTLAVSLGHVKTLIENPYSMTHAALPTEEKLARGIEPGGIRLSVGLEDWQDIIEDLRQALDAVTY